MGDVPHAERRLRSVMWEQAILHHNDSADSTDHEIVTSVPGGTRVEYFWWL